MRPPRRRPDRRDPVRKENRPSPGEPLPAVPVEPVGPPPEVQPPRGCPPELQRNCRLIRESRRSRERTRRQRTFITQQTHALRAHLHAVMGYAGLVLRKTRGCLPDQQVENLNKLLMGAEQLKNAIKQLDEFPY